MKSFKTDIRTLPCLSYASGTADVSSKVIDTKGFNAVAIVVHCATIAASAVTDIYLQHADAASDADTLTNGADVADTSLAIADDDDNQAFVIEVIKPTKRFLQLKVNKDATNAWAGSAIAFLYNADEAPVAHAEASGTSGGAAVVTYEQHIAPIAGTK